MALCSILAYYTNGNVEQIDKLFRRSALFRDKWDRDDSYSAEQIGRALTRFNLEKKDMRLEESNMVSKGCRYLPVPIEHSFDDSDDESYSKGSFPNFDEFD